MARRGIAERNIRTLAKGATSYYVTIPIEAIRDLGWKKRQKLSVEVDQRHGELIVRNVGKDTGHR